jgi:hypothetical protein
MGQQGLQIVIRLLYRHRREGLAAELGPPRQQCRLPFSSAVRLARRSDRHRLAPAVRSATNGAPSCLYQRTAELRGDQIDHPPACRVRPADPVIRGRPAEEPVILSRFPAAFRPPAFDCWASCPARDYAPLTIGLPRHHQRRGPPRGFHVPHVPPPSIGQSSWSSAAAATSVCGAASSAPRQRSLPATSAALLIAG